MTKTKDLRLLREFIGAMFGLDRYVSMNALQDVVGGPDPVDTPEPPVPTTSYEVYRNAPGDAQASVTDYLGGNNPIEYDEQDDDLESPTGHDNSEPFEL